MLETSLILVAAAVVLIAAFTQGLTGFGFVMLGAPLMGLLVEPKVVVPTVLVQSSIINIVILIRAWRWINTRRDLALAIPGALASPLGAYFLVTFDQSSLKVITGLVVTITAIIMLTGYRKVVSQDIRGCVPVGAVSGLLNASTGLAGPAVVLYFANQGVASSEFRSTIVAHFLLITIITFPIFLFGDIFTRDQVIFSIILLPFALVGSILGVLVSKFVTQSVFLKIALLLVIFAGVSSSVAGLYS